MKKNLLSFLLAGVFSTAAIAQTQDPTTTPAEDAEKSSPKTTISVGDAAILGAVQGLTEFLPVSSTGHLILVGHKLGLTEYGDERGPMGRKLKDSDAIDAFDVVLHLGTLLAVVGLYWRRVGQMAGGVFGGAAALFKRKTAREQLSPERKQGIKLFFLLLIAFMPAAVIGLLFHKSIKELYSPMPVAYALAFGAVLMIAVEFWYRRTPGRKRIGIEDLTYWHALAIGLAQTLAMWPGTSRSMMTIVAGLLIGLNMLKAAEFSFLLSLPTIAAATLYEGYKNHGALIESAGPLALVVGVLVSAVVGAAAIKGLVGWLTKHGLTPFGVYRLLLAGVVIWYFSRL
ncbi:MAG: undecaprenyl-diphosphate phosphatase [Phycisphaerae bacterium]|nr:undecaprenyl-diphosphate phosphatase [Phycisphaerae bacterium]